MRAHLQTTARMLDSVMNPIMSPPLYPKMGYTSSWEFSLKSSGHDVFKKLYFLRDIPGRQKKTVSIF